MVQSLRWARPIITVHTSYLMQAGWAVGVVIPARDEEKHIGGVLTNLPEWVDAIVVVNDKSSDNTADVAIDSLIARQKRGWNGKWWLLDLATSDTNEGRSGVGAAIDYGMQYLRDKAGANKWVAENKNWCAAVMDGDGQMCPHDLAALISPITEDVADHVKGSRSMHSNGLAQMPVVRRVGTWVLAHLTNLACGTKLSDPQSGFVVSSNEVIENWDFSSRWDGYGYPNHRLLQLANGNWRVREVPVKSIYNGAKSHLRIPSFFIRVASLLWFGLCSRGWNWYVVGRRNKFTQKRISTSLRIALSTMWFTAWSSIIGVLLLMLTTPDSLLQVVLGLFFVLAMGICRAIDREVCIIREMEFINQRRGKIACFQSRKISRIKNVVNPLHE